MGRPKMDNPKSETVRVRVQKDEHAAWMRAAKRAGLPLSEWIRRLVTAASGYTPKGGKP